MFLLDDAINRLDQTRQVAVLSKSRFYETSPIGGPAGQGAFLNAALLIETLLTPSELLRQVRAIEADLGRRRVERWGPRAIDLDLLLYDDVVVATEHLQLPHPRMAWRRFVLIPAAEVAPDMRHPVIGWTIRELLDHVEHATPYVAIAGPAGVGKTVLARSVADRLHGFLITDPVPLKSYGVALEAELEFAKRRAESVAVESSIWSEGHSLWISDFWVGQSAAAIRTLAEGSKCAALLERLHHVTRQSRTPKLTVFLDAPAAWCARCLAERGLPGPQAEEIQRMDTIRQALIEQMRQAGCGPVLELDGRRPKEALEEMIAAILAMS